MDIAIVKQLIKLMADNELSELNLSDGKKTVSLKRGASTVINHQPTIYGGGAPMAMAPAPAGQAPAHAPAAVHAAAPSAKPATAQAAADSEAGLIAVVSPMVGTFYAAANPDSPPFTAVGKEVGPDTTVCLIEAMKVFNEIKAEKAGRIEKILVQSGQAVEYGQKLFLIKPL
ncbi:MAG: acetyl-CoA carboxylase biotin carboxyl carrier protein [Phycisphaerales bacterium]